MRKTSRRDFVTRATVGASVAVLARRVVAQTSNATANAIPTRELGRTGQRVTIMALRGWHVRAIKDDSDAIRVMHAAIDEGVNFFDNAWDYYDGAAEEVMGKALAMDGRRNKVFLKSKNCNRDYKGSMQCLEDKPAPLAEPIISICGSSTNWFTIMTPTGFLRKAGSRQRSRRARRARCVSLASPATRTRAFI